MCGHRRLGEAEFTDQIRNPRLSFGETAYDRQPGAVRETVEQCHCRIQARPAAGCGEASRLVIHRHTTMIAILDDSRKGGRTGLEVDAVRDRKSPRLNASH